MHVRMIAEIDGSSRDVIEWLNNFELEYQLRDLSRLTQRTIGAHGRCVCCLPVAEQCQQTGIRKNQGSSCLRIAVKSLLRLRAVHRS